MNKGINHSPTTLGASPPLFYGFSGKCRAAPITPRLIGVASSLLIYLFVFVVLKRC
jgi:hypothetical protein